MFARDIGIDLGTANTLVYLKGKGVVMREPSVVAVDTRNDDVLAVGTQAKDMLGRTPGSIIAVRPLRDGVIADFDITATMLEKFIKGTTHTGIFSHPKIVIALPSGVTEVERRAVEDATESAGGRNIELMEEPMAAALGADLPVFEAVGSMVVDIGGGTSEVAVISYGDIVHSCSVRVAGDKFDEAIMAYIKKNHNVSIGERTAEDVKILIGSAFPYDNEEPMEIKGRNLADGMPLTVSVTPAEIRDALADCFSIIIDGVKQTLEQTPPELCADILDRGIVLTGGGALIRGLDKLISRETNIPVYVAENPLDCVVLGTGKRLEMDEEQDYFGDYE